MDGIQANKDDHMSALKPTKRQLEIMRSLPAIVDIRNIQSHVFNRCINDGYIKEMPADGAFMRRYVLTDWGKLFVK